MEIERDMDDDGSEELTAYAMDIVIDQRIDPRRLQSAFNKIRSRQLDDVAFYSGTQWRFDMKRNEWTVPYTGLTLAGAAEAKKLFHKERHEWWAEKRAEVIEKIKSDGLEVTDSIVDELSKTGYANTASMGHGPTVQIDAALQNHLAEAHSKMKQHEKLVKEYDAWAQMMHSQRDAIFNLQLDDWTYFFGK